MPSRLFRGLCHEKHPVISASRFNIINDSSRRNRLVLQGSRPVSSVDSCLKILNSDKLTCQRNHYTFMLFTLFLFPGKRFNLRTGLYRIYLIRNLSGIRQPGCCAAGFSSGIDTFGIHRVHDTNKFSVCVIHTG